MASLTKAEFAYKCKMQSNKLSSRIDEGRVVITPEGLIDDQDGRNKLFYEKRMIYLDKKGIKPDPIQEEIDRLKNELRQVKKNVVKVEPEHNTITSFEKLEQQKQELQNKEIEGKILKLDLTNRKLQGNFIDIEKCKLLVLQLSESINLSWEAEWEDAMLKIGAKHGLSREEISDLKKEKSGVANLARQRAINIAKTMIRRLAEEASVKKSVGEHG